MGTGPFQVWRNARNGTFSARWGGDCGPWGWAPKPHGRPRRASQVSQYLPSCPEGAYSPGCPELPLTWAERRAESEALEPGSGKGSPLGQFWLFWSHSGVAGNPGPWELCGGVGLTISQLVAECLLCAEVWDTDEGLPVWKQGSPHPQEVPENKHEGTTPRGW